MKYLLLLIFWGSSVTPEAPQTEIKKPLIISLRSVNVHQSDSINYYCCMYLGCRNKGLRAESFNYLDSIKLVSNRRKLTIEKLIK